MWTGLRHKPKSVESEILDTKSSVLAQKQKSLSRKGGDISFMAAHKALVHRKKRRG